MAQQISDLVINLDVDSATFTEQIARIKGQLSGVANESEKVQTRMRSAAEAQITALKTTCDAGAGAVSDMQRRQAGFRTNCSGSPNRSMRLTSASPG